MFTRLLWIITLLAGCGKLNYNDLPADGRFEGTLLVMWVGENETGRGDGKFVFVPAPGDELRFVRAKDAKATVREIKPGMMYTDGGSIPREIQLFNGFSPWGYAPAYMIHDWLFVARRCWEEEDATAEEAQIASMDFIETAEIIGEAIKALVRSGKVQQNDVAPRAISLAVAGPISENLWEKPADCSNDRITPEHRAQITAALEPQAAAIILGDPGTKRTPLPPQTPAAQIVGEITF